MEYTVIIEKNPETGMYIGQCKQLPEVLSQGNTLEELMGNIKEAIELAIECRKEELREAYLNRKVFHRKVRVSA
jgi:predicted RNase H-like HicB family nuclease